MMRGNVRLFSSIVETGEGERGVSIKFMETERLGAVLGVDDIRRGGGEAPLKWFEYAGDQFSQKATQTPEVTMKHRSAWSVSIGRRSSGLSMNELKSKLGSATVGVGRAEDGVDGEVMEGIT